MLILIPLIAFASLAIDMGRVRLARADLQAGADAAARAGVSALPTDTNAAAPRAVIYAAANKCLGTSIAVNLGTDVELGRWDPAARTFTKITPTGKVNDPIRTSNAVHVTTLRADARNTAVLLRIPTVLGPPKTDVASGAIAYIHGGPTRFGIVALDKFDANGNKATIDSYHAATETYPGYGGYNSNASLASNGDIDMGNGDVYGDVRAGINGSLSLGPNADVTGWRNNLDEPLSYPAATVPSSAVKLPSGSTIPGGTAGNPTVYMTNTLNGNITFTGSVQIYVTGNVDLKGSSVITSGNLPSNLEIYVVGTGKVDLGGNTEMYAHVYAPQSDITIHGTPGFYGWIVGKTITLKGTSDIHYDESIVSTAPYMISLVK